MPSLSTCPCCPLSGHPSGYEEEPSIPGLTDDELKFDETKHLDLGFPEVIKKLDRDMHYDSETVKALPTDYGCCSAFKVMSKEGSRVINKVLSAIDKHAMSSPRIPKVNRGVTFRNKFLNDLGHSPAILKLVNQLAGCELIYHPMRIQQLHTNLKPPPKKLENGKVVKQNVDRWHCDTTGFVLVLFCTDPDEYEGGELQYFNGTKEEGIRFFQSESKALPADRVLNVGKQHQGYGVFMQGCRVFHQVTPVTKGDNRTTMVFSFQPVNPLALEAATHLSETYNQIDPFQLFLPDWVRYRAWRAMCRFDLWRKKITETNKEESEKTVDFVRGVVDTCNDKLRKIVESLPYSADRKILSDPLLTSIADLKQFLIKQGFLISTSSVNEEDDDAEKRKRQKTEHESHDENSVVKKFVDPYPVLKLTQKGKESAEKDLMGWGNLLGVVADIQSCANDILTIKEKEATMEYF